MKRIICCLDGTWNTNEPGSILTNVAKLQQALAATDANGIRQVSHYITGIASTPGKARQYLKGAVGYGVSDRIRTAYEELARSYDAGDEIHLFGFSRGAFEVRSLASFIELFGVAKRDGAFSFDTGWAIYRRPPARRDAKVLATLRAEACYPAWIKCIGVWDTVGNIGDPLISTGPIGHLVRFHDTRLSPSIDVNLHALAIDEVRGPFRPRLWTMPKGSTLPTHQHVEQIWFAGTHNDVGGGYAETQLSDIALLWMAERVSTTTGLTFDMDSLRRTTSPDPLGPQHCVATGKLYTWSGLFPFVRLIKQRVTAISLLRRILIGPCRSGYISRGEVPVNEGIHDSATHRFGQRVIELRNGRSRLITYRPRNVAAALRAQGRVAMLAVGITPYFLAAFLIAPSAPAAKPSLQSDAGPVSTPNGQHSSRRAAIDQTAEIAGF
jgi:Uncharacterized alpha/beta hydrolase domain (DUF2235)